MRIGFDGSVLAPATRFTGTGQYAEHLLRFAATLSPDDEFIVYGTRPRDVEWPANVRWRRVKAPRLGKLTALATHLLRLPRLVARDRLDLLHVPTVHTRPSLPPVPRFISCPLVVTLHDVIPITFYERQRGSMPLRLRLYYRWNLRAAKTARAIITVSSSARNDIIRELGIPPERITVIPNGIDASFWSAPAGAANPAADVAPYILFGGSYEPRKNLDRLLEAFAIAMNKGLNHNLVAIVDAGSGHEPAARAAVQRLGIWSRVRFLSHLSPDDLRAVYQGADIFAFPSLSEGFGLPPLQAMAAGVPVVASDLPVMREVLGDAARYIDPLSAHSIADALLCLASDPGERERLATRGRAHAGEYSWERAAASTLDVYRSVAGRRK
jgi:glycosyltransferase involved in cell wall biosynthesis